MFSFFTSFRPLKFASHIGSTIYTELGLDRVGNILSGNWKYATGIRFVGPILSFIGQLIGTTTELTTEFIVKISGYETVKKIILFSDKLSSIAVVVFAMVSCATCVLYCVPYITSYILSDKSTQNFISSLGSLAYEKTMEFIKYIFTPVIASGRFFWLSKH